MALDDIFRALEEQADKEIEQLLQDAGDQASVIDTQAEEDAERIREERVEAAQKLTRAQASQRVNAAKLEGKKRVAAVKEQAVSESFQTALEQLGSLRSTPEYAQVFRAYAEEALAGLEGDLTAYVDPADADLARTTFADMGVLVDLKPEISTRGGLVMSVRDGRIMRRNTVEDRLEKVRQGSQADVAEILFS